MRIGFSFLLQTVNLFRHLNRIEHGLLREHSVTGTLFYECNWTRLLFLAACWFLSFQELISHCIPILTIFAIIRILTKQAMLLKGMFN